MIFLRELDYVFQYLHQLGEEIVSVVFCGEKPYCGIFCASSITSFNICIS